MNKKIFCITSPDRRTGQMIARILCCLMHQIRDVDQMFAQTHEITEHLHAPPSNWKVVDLDTPLIKSVVHMNLLNSSFQWDDLLSHYKILVPNEPVDHYYPKGVAQVNGRVCDFFMELHDFFLQRSPTYRIDVFLDSISSKYNHIFYSLDSLEYKKVQEICSGFDLIHISCYEKLPSSNNNKPYSEYFQVFEQGESLVISHNTDSKTYFDTYSHLVEKVTEIFDWIMT